MNDSNCCAFSSAVVPLCVVQRRLWLEMQWAIERNDTHAVASLSARLNEIEQEIGPLRPEGESCCHFHG